MDHIGIRIKEVRKDNQLTQEQFGQKIGLKDSAVSMLEKNERRLTDSVIKNIISQFCVNESWLRNGLGEKYNEDLLKTKTLLNEPFTGRQLLLLQKIQGLEPSQQDEILKILESSPDQLIKTINSSYLNSENSTDEEELLNGFRKLNPGDKKEVVSFVNFKLFNYRALKKKQRSSNCSDDNEATDIQSIIV